MSVTLKMEHYLRPARFGTLPNTPESSDAWKHWYKTFWNFCNITGASTSEQKLQLLTNYVSHSVYSLISECISYQSAIDILTKLYDKPQNEISARHFLTTRCQQTDETIDEYLQALEHLSKSCNFKAVSGEDYRNEYIRDAFIKGLISTEIRQKLLENTTLSLMQASEQARSLELAEACAQSPIQSNDETLDIEEEDEVPEGNERKKCTECGKDFTNFSHLRRHAKQVHPDKLDEIAPSFYKNKNNFKFSCDRCDRNFNNERHLRFHLKSHEQKGLVTDYSEESIKKQPYNLKKCPLCNFSALLSEDMLTHFNEVHDIRAEYKDLVFPSLDGFENWLKDTEKETHARYVKMEKRSSKKHFKLLYVCHRSGFYITRGQGLRHMKIKGSVKINGHCPACIKLFKDNNTGVCNVSYIDTHVGHTIDIDPS